MNCRALGLIAFLVVCVPVFAADDGLPPIHINRAGGPIVVDGDLSDAGWQGAAKFETWYETNPGDNIEPKVKQIGYVAYDEHFIYVGIDMWDPDPAQINSIYGDHDALSGNTDDYAGLLIDSRNDKKTGYLFLVNAHGIQYDASTDDSSGEDNSPDYFWDSAAKRNEHGWAVEMRIPFSSIRYHGSTPTFNIALYRNRPRDRRYQMFTVKLPRGTNCFVCFWAKSEGFAGLPAGGHIVAAPYITARSNGDVRDGSTHIVQPPVGANAGADIKWIPNADTALDAAINPDFSQVESDTAAISTNQRFAIFFPEKRPFFLENTDLFSTPIQAVYTRTITAPRWGLRSTGKYGSNAYTLLVADDRGGGSVIIPSPFGSNFADQDFASRAVIARVRHDFGKNSFASFLATTRDDEGGGHNRVFGPDFRLNSEHNTVTGQLLFSQSRTPDHPELAEEWDGRKLHSYAGDLWWQWNTKSNDFFTEAKSYGDQFRADNGFVPQVGYRSNYAEYGHTYWPTKNFFSRIRVFTMGQYDALQDGSMLYRLAPSFGFGADGAHRSFIRLRYANDEVRNIDPSRGIDTLFNRHQLLYSLQTGVNRLITFVTADGFVGQDVDFTNNRLGRGASMNLSVNLRPSDRFTIDLLHRQQWLTEPIAGASPSADGPRHRLFTAQVERVRALYSFNSRMFLRAIVQNERTALNHSLYSPSEVTGRSGDLATQFLFAYKLNWQTLMYVGVGDLRETNGDGGLEPSARQFFFKLSYAFQR